MTEKKRYFTDEELQMMAKTPLEIAREALDNGDIETAKQGLEGVMGYFNMVHDMYLDWCTALMTHIYETQGADALEEAFTPSVRASMADTLRMLPAMSYEDAAKTMIMTYMCHLEPLEIVEDDEKLTVNMKHCGACQRQREDGCYDCNGPFATMSKHSTTWDTDDFPIYGVHAPIIDKIAIEETGRIFFAYEHTNPVGAGPCKISLYKDPNDIPEELYTRIGYEKPQL